MNDLGREEWPLDFKRLLPRLLPLVAVAVVYGQAIGFDFINYDDNLNVYANPLLAELSPEMFARFWTAPYEGLYIPLTYSLWALLVKLPALFSHAGQPLNPHLFHAANVFVHGLNTLVLAALLRRLLKQEWPAAAGALLFALHPVQVEAVAWVSSMRDLLSGFFSLLALWCFVLFCQAQEPSARFWRYVLALVCYGAALLAKPGAVVVPLLAVVLGLFHLQLSPRQAALFLAPWVLMAVPVVMITKFAQPETLAIFVPPLWQRLLVAGDALSFYAAKLVFPKNLASDYGRTPQFVVGQGWYFFTGVMSWLLVAWSGWRCRCRCPWFLAALGLFVAAILPVSGLVPFSYQAMSTVADRYLYLALLGPAYLAGRLLLNCRGRRLVWWAFVVLLGVWAARSLAQLPTWRNSLSFNTGTLNVNPRSWTAATNLGVKMMEQQQVEEGIALYQRAIDLNPGYVTAYYNLGVAQALRNEDGQAVLAYQKAIETGPYFFLSYNNLCNLYLKIGRGDLAVEVFRQAVKVFADPVRDPGLTRGINETGEPAVAADNKVRAMLYNIAGRLRLEMDQPEEASQFLTRAASLDPALAEAFNNLGNAYVALGQGEKAIASYSRVTELMPQAAGPYSNICLAYNSLNRGEEAVAACQQAIARDAGYGEAYVNLGNAYHSLGRDQESVSAYQRALAIEPGHAWAAFNAAAVSEGLNNPAGAMAFYRQAIQISPDFAEAYLNLSRVLLRQGQREAAAEMYRQAKGLGLSDSMLDGVLP